MNFDHLLVVCLLWRVSREIPAYHSGDFFIELTIFLLPYYNLRCKEVQINRYKNEDSVKTTVVPKPREFLAGFFY